MVKQTGGATNWVMYDTTRSPTNPNGDHIFANLANAENTDASFNFDLLSNGFKVRGTTPNINADDGNYVYCCFAENPFGGSNVSPVTAR